MGDFNQAKYIQQFQKENYDRCIFNVPKGKKKLIIDHYKKLGYESMNQYINALIHQDMNGGVLRVNKYILGKLSQGLNFSPLSQNDVSAARYAC